MTIARLAVPGDADVIARIYNQGIEERLPPSRRSRDGRADRRAAGRQGRPVPHCRGERAGAVTGGRPPGPPQPAGVTGRRGTFVYVERSDALGGGRVALDALCREYAARGFWKLVADLFPRTSRARLHERAGFASCVYHRHGKLAGEWRDCVIVEKLLGDHAVR